MDKYYGIQNWEGARKHIHNTGVKANDGKGTLIKVTNAVGCHLNEFGPINTNTGEDEVLLVPHNACTHAKGGLFHIQFEVIKMIKDFNGKRREVGLDYIELKMIDPGRHFLERCPYGRPGVVQPVQEQDAPWEKVLKKEDSLKVAPLRKTPKQKRAEAIAHRKRKAVYDSLWMTTVKRYLPQLGLAAGLAAATCWFFPNSEHSSGNPPGGLLSTVADVTPTQCGIAAGLVGATAIGGALAYRSMSKQEDPQSDSESDSIIDKAIETVKDVFVES